MNRFYYKIIVKVYYCVVNVFMYIRFEIILKIFFYICIYNLKLDCYYLRNEWENVRYYNIN